MTGVRSGCTATGVRSVCTIGVNLTWLVPGVVGGSEEYTMRLLDSVQPLLGDRVRLQLYVRPELVSAYPDLSAGYRLITAPEIDSKAARIGLEQTWLAYATRGDDFVHHAGGTVPYVRSQPAIVTIHDLQPLEMPRNFDPVKRAWLGRALPYAARVARLVLCPSRFTAERLHQVLDVPPDKTRVVVHGHRPSCSPADSVDLDATAPTVDIDGMADPAETFGRYLLYPAIAYPHKRHLDLVQALERLDARFDDVQLVFTGRPGPEIDRVMAEAGRLGLDRRVHVLGRVPAAELDCLYRSAAALVFPSAYEGFGNPVLEAMNAGCPVLASDAGALPEVIGDAGLLFPVGDVEAIAGAIALALGDRWLADSLRDRGRRRARSFDSGIAAQQLADVYGELADSRLC